MRWLRRSGEWLVLLPVWQRFLSTRRQAALAAVLTGLVLTGAVAGGVSAAVLSRGGTEARDHVRAFDTETATATASSTPGTYPPVLTRTATQVPATEEEPAATPAPPPPTSARAGAGSPCVAAPPPASWRHVIVLMFENETYSQVIGAKDANGNLRAPYITGLAWKCASSSDWHDANYNVDGSSNGNYDSKPNYATLTSGVPPSVHGLTDDTYSTKTSVDNIYNELRKAGKSGKDYFDAPGSGCGTQFSGSYHDPIRYYSDIDTAYCDAHDVSLSAFMADVNDGGLPEFSVVLPTNCENMHSCGAGRDLIATGDTWASRFLPPLLDSALYRSGDTAVRFLWDEDTPIPNVLLAPSVVPGSTPGAAGGAPISHFSALRTWEDMLGLPLIGDTARAPSLLPFFDGWP